MDKVEHVMCWTNHYTSFKQMSNVVESTNSEELADDAMLDKLRSNVTR